MPAISLDLPQFVTRLRSGHKDTSLRPLRLERHYAWWNHVGDECNFWWKLTSWQVRWQIGHADIAEAFPVAVDLANRRIVRCNATTFERTTRRVSVAEHARRSGFDSAEQMWSYYGSMRRLPPWEGFKVFSLVRWTNYREARHRRRTKRRK